MASSKHRVHQDTMGFLLDHTADGYRQSQERRGIKPKDHAKENVRKMREQQHAFKLRKDQESQAAAPKTFKLKQFDGAESKVAAVLQSASFTESDHKNFMRAGAGDKRRSRQREAAVLSASTTGGGERRKPAVPRVSDLGKLPDREYKNMIGINKCVAALVPQRVAPSLPPKKESFGMHKRGSVPQYLVERTRQKEEEQKWRDSHLPDPECPSGMIVMPEEERVQTLTLLQESHKELLFQLNAMPIRIETLGQRQRKAELEEKVTEVEDALKIFQRSKVFEPDPSYSYSYDEESVATDW